MSRQRKALAVAVVLGLVGVLFGLRIQGLLQRGEDVFWLAELWAPAAFLSIGLVTGLEILLAKDAQPGPPKAARARRPQGRK
jgi:hypothetical protein